MRNRFADYLAAAVVFTCIAYAYAEKSGLGSSYSIM